MVKYNIGRHISAIQTDKEIDIVSHMFSEVYFLDNTILVIVCENGPKA